MRSILVIIAITTLLLLLQACNNGRHEMATMATDDMRGQALEQHQSGKAMPAPDAPVVMDRKIIKDGRLRFRTNNLGETRISLNGIISAHNGYISNEQEYRFADQISQTITVRVPAANFDKLIDSIAAGVDRFDERNIDATDVTEEYVDIAARLKTKKELEQRYLELLQRANTVKDLLEIEREIGNLRSEIESIEGRLKYLNNRIDLSTLHITFYERVARPVEFGNKFTTGLRNGWNNLIYFIIGLINIWPFVVITIILVFVILRWRRRRRLNRM